MVFQTKSISYNVYDNIFNCIFLAIFAALHYSHFLGSCKNVYLAVTVLETAISVTLHLHESHNL